METAILTGIGLAAPAGLNAYIPLLALALADRATTQVTLHAPYDVLSSNIGIAILIVLLTIEIAVDKIPGVDHVNDIIQSFVRPAAGAIVGARRDERRRRRQPGGHGASRAGAGRVGERGQGDDAAGRDRRHRRASSIRWSAWSRMRVAILASVVAIFLPALVILFLAIFAVSSILLLRRFRRLRAGGPR